VAARDDLSKAAEGRALSSNTAEAIAQFFWEQIYCRYGAVGQIVTDNGSEFKGAFKLLHERMKVPQILISTYNLKANGVVERVHFNIREGIIKACGNNLYQWPDKVTVSQTTGWSPHYILHGVHPVLPLDLFEHTFLITGFGEGLSSSGLFALQI
jgi:transposase InsO family protein